MIKIINSSNTITYFYVKIIDYEKYLPLIAFKYVLFGIV